jgi:predicted DNA-binding protein with PD1-like motif
MKLSLPEFKPGRRFAGPLLPGSDIITSIEATCKELSIQMASFSVGGAVSSFTIGAYDQTQQVFVTHAQTAPREIVACSGTVSLKNGQPRVDARIALGDAQGKITGGQLFSQTIIFTGEIDLQELIGRPIERIYDSTSGRFVWMLPE